MIAKVIRAFRERFQDMRLYNVGDTYQADEEERVEYLVSQGFLTVERDVKTEEEPVSAEEPTPEPTPEPRPPEQEKSKRQKKGVKTDDPDT